jgi:hypothetical protein
MKNKRTAFDGQPSDGPLVEQHIERQFDHALDFLDVRPPRYVWFETCDNPGRHQKIAGKNIAIGELAENQVGCFESKFFVQLTKSRIDGRLAGIDGAAGKTDLTGVMGERERPFRKGQTPAAGSAEQQ